MARAKGLGPGGRRAIERWDDTPDDEAGIPQKGGPLSRTPNGLRSLIGTGPDFGPYFVESVDQYYQGPSRSSMVVAHQFVPLEGSVEDAYSVFGEQFQQWIVRGYIYVRFRKSRSGNQGGGTPGTLTRYGPCTLSEYRTFRESASKGRSTRALEVFGFQNLDSTPSGVDI